MGDNKLQFRTTIMMCLTLFVALVGFVTAEFDLDLHSKYKTMPKPAFVEYFNKQNFSFQITHYDNIEEHHVGCAILDMETLKQLPVLTHDLEGLELPENFDARTQWPQCETIKEIYDQKECGACWTFGTANPASDRTCIHKNIHVRLSEEDFECLQKYVCNGGDPIKAFNFWKKHGLVTQECKPYNVTELRENICVTKCVTSEIDYAKDKHFAEKVYRISDDSDQIKAEIVKNGPIQAGFAVYDDFYNYKKGVYVYKYGELLGYHSVRVLGYGVEDGVDYWLVANSWGSGWGDHGYFKIKPYQKDIQFENYMIAGMPKN